MAGNIGSPLCAELNRIANNGVYPDRDDFLEEQGAANVWAGTTGQGLLGALNYIVDPTRTENNFSDLTKVCNELAGTTGLSDVDALRTINHPAEVLLRGTTPQSAVFATDAATPRYNYPGYLYFNGTSGNGISLQDSNDLDITGDIDIRVKMLPQDWTTGAGRNLLSKGGATTWSYCLFLNSANRISLSWSTDGVIGTRKEEQSTATVPLTDGTVGWVRAALDVNNGASGYSVYFYTSTDGTTWTQLGSTVTVAGVTSIYSGTGSIQLFENNALTSATEGRGYQAQIFASLDGTDKRLDVDLTTNVTSATYDQFTATTGQLCTINGQNTLTNGGSAGSLLPVTVGSSLAADSNDAKFLDHTGTNYVYLPGVNGNYISVPDADALDITGDMDVRVQVAMDDWTPSSDTALMAKWAGGGSWILRLQTNGTLVLLWRESGGTTLTKASTASVAAADGTVKWVRATLDVDNGASGNDVKFFTSDNGTSWTQLGTTVTTAGVTNIAVSAFAVQVGIYDNGFGQPATGKFYRAQIFNGIDGTKVLDVDTSVITTGAATSFTALTNQTVTINRSTSGRKTVAVTQPTWLFGTDDYMEVNNRYMAHSTSDENYVYLSGANNNSMSVADNPPLDVTGDIDIQIKVAMDDWTPTGGSYLLSKVISGSGNYSYAMQLTATGFLVLAWSSNGTTFINKQSTASVTATDGSTLWVRSTLDVDNGASGNDVKFYTSTDGITWTQLGSTVTTAGVTSIYSGTSIVEIGAFNGGSAAKGKFYRAIIKNGIDGTTVLDANAAVITLPSQTTFTDSSSNAYTVTINKSGVGTFVSTGNYLYLPGINLNYASAPDSAALDVTGDIDLRCKVALDDWTPTGNASIISKWGNAGNQSYLFQVYNSGVLRFTWTSTGTYSASLDKTSTVSTGVADGSVKWIRVTLDVDNGASGNDVKFWTSNDGITWTQLGSTITSAGTTSVYASSAVTPLEVGSTLTGTTEVARGKFFRAQVLNGIGGTLAFDANFEGSITSLNQASFTESSSNAATVTINRSGSTYRSAGVIDAGYLYPGATNTFANSTIDYLNFGATDSFTAIVIARRFGNPASDQRILMKWDSSGYYFSYITTGVAAFNINGTGSGSTSTGFSSGTLSTISGLRNVSSDNLILYVNTTESSPGADNTTTSLATTNTLNIGRQGVTSSQFADMEFYAAAVFRSVLTPKNIADITNYYNGRD